jgi:hypothetical protein
VDQQHAWPARFPDLNPLYFCVCAHLPSTVCASVVGDIHDLQQRIQNRFEMIRNDTWNVAVTQAGRCSDAYRPALKLKVDIFFNCQQAVTRKQCLRIPLLKCFFLYCGVDKAVPWLRRLVAGLLPQMSGFDPGSVHVGFMVDKVALGQVFPRVFRFSPVNFIPPVLHYLEK